MNMMNFGSFSTDDLNNIEPTISLPIKKRSSKPSRSPSLSDVSRSSSQSDLSRSDSQGDVASELNGSRNDNNNHTSSPSTVLNTSSHSIHPNSPPITPPSTNNHNNLDHLGQYSGHNEHYYPPASYEPHPYMYNMPPYVQYPYLPHIPPHMSHMQHMHMQHMPPYGMPQQHMSPHPNPHPNPSHHSNHHPHTTHHSQLSANSPSFTPAHLHHVHNSAQYPVRTHQYEYPNQPPLHPQQAQEQVPHEEPPFHQVNSLEANQSPSPQVSIVQSQTPPPHDNHNQHHNPPNEIQQSQPQPQQSQIHTLDQQSQPAQPSQTSQTPQPQSSQLSQTSQVPQTQNNTQPPSPSQSSQSSQPQPTQPPQSSQPSQEGERAPGKHRRRHRQQAQQAQQGQAQQTQPSQQAQHTPAQVTQPTQPTPSQNTVTNTTTTTDTTPTTATPTDQTSTTTTTTASNDTNADQQPSDTVAQATEPSKGPKNWASLFASKAPNSSLPPSSAPSTTPSSTSPVKTNPNSNDSVSHKKANGVANGKSTTSSSASNDLKSPQASPLVPLSVKLLQDLSKLSLSSSVPLQYRGLKNPTNTCFLNVILQSLIHCPPFAQLLSKLSSVELPASQMPVTDKFVRLYCEFLPHARQVSVLQSSTPQLSSSSSTPTSALNTGNPKHSNNNNVNIATSKQPAVPMLPELFFDLLYPFSLRTGIPYKDGDKMNQQDAQEFLTYVLDLMHEEFISFSLANSKSKEAKEKEADSKDKADEWEEVGKKNKSSIVLTQSDTHASSVLSHIFGGKQRSSVRKQSQGSKPSVTIQPFYCLHLDIDKPHIKTLEDALDTYMEPEKLEGYTCDVRGVEVPASKHTSIEALPRVLIIHLKRFAYDLSQARKLDKVIHYPQKLTIKKNFLSSEKVANDDKRVYALYSVVEHHGKMAVKGHYTCDINIGNRLSKPSPANATQSSSTPSSSSSPAPSSEWLHFDDHNVTRAHQKEVQNRLAYLLFYVQQ